MLSRRRGERFQWLSIALALLLPGCIGGQTGTPTSARPFEDVCVGSPTQVTTAFQQKTFDVAWQRQSPAGELSDGRMDVTLEVMPSDALDERCPPVPVLVSIASEDGSLDFEGTGVLILVGESHRVSLSSTPELSGGWLSVTDALEDDIELELSYPDGSQLRGKGTPVR